MKKLSYLTLSFIMTLITLLGFQNPTLASTEDTSSLSPGQIVERIVPENPEEFLKEKGWEKPSKDAKLVEIVRVTNSTSASESSTNESLIAPLAGNGYYVKAIGGERNGCGYVVRARTSGTGNANGVLTLTQAVSVSNTFRTDVNVSAQIISAGVGFDVTRQWTSTASYAVNTGGKNYQIVAYDDYVLQDFEVWNDPTIGWDYKVGSGTAYRQVGFCYAVYEI